VSPSFMQREARKRSLSSESNTSRAGFDSLLRHRGDEESRETVEKSGDRGTGRLHDGGGDGR
jgi:hypothetical protein